MGNPVIHFEIAGRDGRKLESFYAQLFGWKIDRREAGGHPYGQIHTGDEGGIGGGIRHEPEGRAEVVFYVKVPNLAVAVAKAEQLGAAVRIPPIETPEVTFAVITDPEGNPVGMIQKKSVEIAKTLA